MPKPHKIKRYSQKTGYRASKQRKKKIGTALFGILLVALVFVGVSAYPAVKDYFDGKVLPTPIPSVAEQSITPESSNVVSVAEEEPSTAKVEAARDIAGKIIPYETAVDPQLIKEFLANLPQETNTVIFHSKDSMGRVQYRSEIPAALQWQAVVGEVDLSALVSAVTEAGYDFGVIQSVFSDPIAAKGDLENNAIMHSSGVIWLDNSLSNGGKPWATPYSQTAREYNIALAKEAVENGAKVVLFEHMRFPGDVTNSANVKATGDVSRRQVLEGFYEEAVIVLGAEVTVAPITNRAGAEGEIANEQLYGGDPMALDIPIWAVDFGDADAANFNGGSEKRFILLIEQQQIGDQQDIEIIVK